MAFFFFTNCAHASVVLTLLSVHVSGGYVPDPRIDMTCHTPHNKRRTEKVTETSSNLKVSSTACIVKYFQTHTHTNNIYIYEYILVETHHRPGFGGLSVSVSIR